MRRRLVSERHDRTWEAQGTHADALADMRETGPRRKQRGSNQLSKDHASSLLRLPLASLGILRDRVGMVNDVEAQRHRHIEA